MRIFRTALFSAAASIVSIQASAQVSRDTSQVRQQRTLDSLVGVIRAMEARIDTLSSAGPPPSAAPTATPSVETSQGAPAQQGRGAGAYMNVGFVALTDAGWSTEPDVTSLQVGDHDPHVRGFTIPNGEISLDGTVDPYFKGFSNIVYKLDSKGETGVELEEAYFITTALPANLQLKAGQYFAEFGRQNPVHPHAWAFADSPLILNRVFGPEGLRSQGARISWLAPTSWYLEAMVSVMNSAGTTTYSFRSDESSDIHAGVPVDRGVNGLKDLLYVPRVAASFDLTATQTLLVGASGAFGPNNSGTDAATQIYGADLYWKWKSARAHQGFPFVSFQTEFLTRRYTADARTYITNAIQLPRETLEDGGMYGQLLWGIRPLLVAGLRGEFANSDPGTITTTLRQDRYRGSANLTLYPTEFSKIRMQYNYDHREGLGVDHSIWLQIEFLLGAHAAHKF